MENQQPDSISLVKNVLGHLSRRAYEKFTVQLFKSHYRNHFKPYPGGPDSLYVRELSDNWYNAPEGENGHYGIFEGIYLLDYLHAEMFTNPKAFNFISDSLRGLLNRISKDYETRTVMHSLQPQLVPVLNSLYFINNLRGLTLDQLISDILPKYNKAVKEAEIHYSGEVFIGNIDTFLAKQPTWTSAFLTQFLGEHHDGVSIDLCIAGPSVQRLQTDKYLSAGVTIETKSPYEPVFLRAKADQEEALQEFEDLLRRGTKEDKLEAFLRDHYRDVFGPEYDRIETQLWLRFPDLDIADKSRRLDIFLRNGIMNDWELFEVKRYVPLSGTYRDCPVLATEVYRAIQQVKNYHRLLSQEKVKRSLAKEGIEYYEPQLRLVIGQKPQIPHEQWRWLLKTNESDVRILTYDNLLDEMKCRLDEKLRILDLGHSTR